MTRKFTVLFALLISMITFAQAQQGQQSRRTAEEKAKIITLRLTDSLQLSSEQQKSVEAVYLQFIKSMDKVREGLAPGDKPSKEDVQKINNQRDEKLKMTLSPAQYKRLKDDIEPALRRPRGDRQQGDRPPAN